MKKFLACTLALTMTAAMLASCGDSADSSSKSDDASSTTTTTTTTAAESSEAAPDSTADSAAESTADDTSADSAAADSTGDAEGDSSVAEPKDISEMPATLKNYETANLKFSTDKTAEDYGCAPMCEKNFENDESNIELTIEEVAGVPMLRVQTVDMQESGVNYKIPKVRFNMSKIFEGQTEDLAKVFTVKIDFVTKAVGNFVGDDGVESLVPGNFMGAVCTQTGTDPDKLSWNQLIEFAESEWTSEWGSYEVVIRPGIKGNFEVADTDQYLTIMRWSIPNNADFYIADISFLDEDNNPIELKNYQ